MYELIKAIELERKYNKMDLHDVVKEFEEYTNQEITEKIIDDFRFCGLSNIDFLTSDFLNKYGLRNIIQIYKAEL